MKGPPAHPAGREPVADPAILVAESGGFSPAAAARLRELGALALRDLDRGQLLDAIGETDVLWAGLRHSLDRELLERATRLRAIVTPTTGLDHVDLDTATELGIEVLSLRDRTNELREVRATAEHTIGLLLGLLRRVPSAVEHVRAGGWDRNRFWGSEIHGKTVGIVGYGRLGQIVGRYLTAFDASILASDPAVDAGAFEPPVQRAGLEELLARAEILTLHASLTDGSRGLIGRRELELMPRGSVLVNTARGALIDEQALLEALRSGQLAGAALDTVADERGSGSAALLEHARSNANLLITPHIGGLTHESRHTTEMLMVDQLATYLERRQSPVR